MNWPACRAISNKGRRPRSRTLCAFPFLASLSHPAVVLMSYEQLRDQMFATTSTQNASLLNQFGFWRVVLDEAQLVANSSSVAAVVASSLWRRHAWVVTGTPISSKLDEIRGEAWGEAMDGWMDWNWFLGPGLCPRQRAVVLACTGRSGVQDAATFSPPLHP